MSVLFPLRPTHLALACAVALVAAAPVRAQSLAEVDVRALVHELQVHQIELEMQNEALRQARSEMEESRDRYANLFDFAPMAYVTVAVRNWRPWAKLGVHEITNPMGGQSLVAYLKRPKG